VCLGVQREHPSPAEGVHHQRRAEVLRELGSDAPDLLQRLRAHGVMRPDAHGRDRVMSAGLLRAVEDGLLEQSPTGGPARPRVGVADARRRDVADAGIRERADHLAQVARRRAMVGVELGDHVVVAVADMVVEEGEVALLGLRAARPGRAVVVRASVACGDAHAVCLAPAERLRGRRLVGEPDVVRVGQILAQHRPQRAGNHLPGLRRRLGDDDGHSQLRNAQRRVGARHPGQVQEEDTGQEQRPYEHGAVDNHSERGDDVAGLQPPAPEVRQRGEPQSEQRREHDPLARAHDRDQKAPAGLDTHIAHRCAALETAVGAHPKAD
jgi:hypothetical protein